MQHSITISLILRRSCRAERRLRLLHSFRLKPFVFLAPEIVQSRKAIETSPACWHDLRNQLIAPEIVQSRKAIETSDTDLGLDRIVPRTPEIVQSRKAIETTAACSLADRAKASLRRSCRAERRLRPSRESEGVLGAFVLTPEIVQSRKAIETWLFPQLASPAAHPPE